MERITVVKIGGNVIDDPAAMKRFLAGLRRAAKARKYSSTEAESSPRGWPSGWS